MCRRDCVPLVALLFVLGIVSGHAAEQSLQPSDLADDDYFGESVGISGDNIIVGALYDDDLGGSSGSACIFNCSNGTWSDYQKMTADDGETADNFGTAVAIDGEWAVVGAPYEDEGGTSAGAAYVFRSVGGIWDQYAKLVAADAQSYDHFGEAVDVSGDTIVVGVVDSDDAGEGTGSAYVFHLDGSVWTEQDKLLASDMESHDNFGFAVAISGDTVIVGAYRNDDACDPPDSMCQSGAAYVFTRSGSGWSQATKLLASDDEASDNFGYSVSIDGNRALVGAPRNDSPASEAGAVYVFSGISGWGQVQKLTASDAEAVDRFGEAVALSGHHALIAAPLEDDAGIEAGAVYTFAGGATMVEVGKEPSNEGMSNEFGEALDADGAWAVVGAHYHWYGYGAAYAYRLDELDPTLVFSDGFESGDTTAWSASAR